MDGLIAALSERLRSAATRGEALQVRGGGTKAFHARVLEGTPLDVSGFSGIVSYEPSELVITARAGTPLAELEAVLAEAGQMLACEPPRFGPGTTLGGCVAAGLSGPRRASAGSLRDFVLGVRLLDGQGQDLHFGGQVMKNVAGFDVARLMAGSWGTLGVLLEVSLKVLPRPETELTLQFPMGEDEAITRMNQLAGQPQPVSATCYADGVLSLRLSGSLRGVAAARARLGGEMLAAGDDFWRSVRDQQLPVFQGTPLWRLSVRSTAPPLDLPGPGVLEWQGSLRWLRSDAPPDRIRACARAAGGHAVLFRPATTAGTLAAPAAPPPLVALDPVLLALHQRLKAVFDPAGILSRHRLHPDW